MFVKMYHGPDPKVPEETTYAAVFDGRMAPCSGEEHSTWGQQDGFARLKAYMDNKYGYGFMHAMSVPEDHPDAVTFMHGADLVWQGEV